LNSEVKDYLYSLERSLILCTQLINNQRLKSFTQEDYNHLMLLIYNNFNLQKMKLFYFEFIRLFEIRIRQNVPTSEIENGIKTSEGAFI
jgi:hypothetical protein